MGSFRTMDSGNDILSLLLEKGALVAKQAQRGVILQPGALGDGILTLPLAGLMKESLGLGGLDILGHTEYLSILPERTVVDSVRSMESVDLHRLFVEPAQFDPEDKDPLVELFSDYTWIVTFLGEPESPFEQNLIFTANCSHSAEVIALSMKPPDGLSEHVTTYYAKQFVSRCDVGVEYRPPTSETTLIRTTTADRRRGKQLIEEVGVDSGKPVVLIQPGSGGRHKCWHIENYLAVSRKLRSDGRNVLFLLGPAEQDRFDARVIDQIGRTATVAADLALSDVVGLLSCAGAYAGNDSGITHLAAAMGVPTVVLFGPTDPGVYRPIGPSVTVLRAPDSGFTDQPNPVLQQQTLDALTA